MHLCLHRLDATNLDATCSGLTLHMRDCIYRMHKNMLRYNAQALNAHGGCCTVYAIHCEQCAASGTMRTLRSTTLHPTVARGASVRAGAKRGTRTRSGPAWSPRQTCPGARPGAPSRGPRRGRGLGIAARCRQWVASAARPRVTPRSGAADASARCPRPCQCQFRSL